MAESRMDTLSEREPVRFDIPAEGLSDAELRLVQHIKEVAEETLYHWRTFPIVLPAPVAVQNSDVNSSSLARRKPIVVRDLFVAPCFDELEAVALDSGGEPRKLSSQQLSSVRESGEFEVDSVNFPGQVHRWRLSELLQKGTERSYQSYLDDLALSLRFLIVTARGRVSSHFFSLRQSLRSLLRGLVLLVDVFAGFPSLQSCDLDSKLMEERSKYLVAELVCKPDQEEQLDELCHYVRRQLARLQLEKSEPTEADRPPLLYTFHTPHGLTVDLRLFDRDLMKRATPVLAGVLESEARGWFAPFRERAITELQSQGLDDEQIRTSACAAVQEEYLRRVLAAVRASPPLEELGEGVCRLLAENAQSVVLMQRAVENVSQKLASFQKSLRHFIDTHHPVRSRIDAWVRHKFRAAESRFALEHQWAAHEEALALCKENGLQQTAYFLQRDLSFMREREPVLQKELRRVKTPTREFEWRAHIWLWSNWTVYRRFQGDSKAIPTVISQTSTSITNPRNNPSEPVFVLEKEVVRTTTTRWLFWRWCNFLYRLWSWGSNGFYLLGVVIPWSSPVSLRALLCVEPFTPDLELSQVNGTLCPRRSSLTPTLTSRLISLWRHISKSRTEFETSPDTGFIGKEMTRHLNRVWNYALKGAVGTLLLVTLFPAACLVTSLVSLLLAAAVPLWAPAAVLLFHIFLVLCYDFDAPSPERNRWCVLLEALVWHIGVLGVLQPLAAVLVAGMVCPLLALTVLVYGWLRWCCRRLWDRVAYDAVVSRKGRIPCSDSVLVTRVHGPGLSSDYHLQIRAEQALAAFEARLEADELAAFARQTARRIEQPQTACAAFVSRVLSPFSAQLSGTGVYGKLCEEAKQLNSTLQEQIEKRQYDLQTALTPAQRRKVKLTPRDLQLTLVAGARMLEDFYPGHVLARLSAAAEGAGDVTADVTGDAAFWEGRGLAAGDWAGLSAQVLTEVFSAEVLTPLHHTDTHFYLEIHRVSLHRYTELLRRAAAVPVPVPLVQTAAHIQVAAPSLELAVFSPSAGRGRDRSASGHRSASRRLRPWKRQRSSAIYTAEKLTVRLPLPHPLRVALTVYNREADSPVCAEDDPACRRLLAALESVTTAHAQTEEEGVVISESLERESEEGRESEGHVEVSVDDGGGGDSASIDDSRREYTIDSTSGYRIDDDVIQIADNPIAGTSQPSRWTSVPLGSSIVTTPTGAGSGPGHSRDASLASIDFITVRLSELAMMDSGEDHGDLRSQSLRTTDV